MNIKIKNDRLTHILNFYRINVDCHNHIYAIISENYVILNFPSKRDMIFSIQPTFKNKYSQQIRKEKYMRQPLKDTGYHTDLAPFLT